MRCSCGHENARSAAYCEVCGAELGSGAAASPPRRPNPAVKRRTLLEVPAPASSPSPSLAPDPVRDSAVSPSFDFLSVPPRARGVIDPNDPFRRPAPAQQEGSPAVGVGRRRKAKTILERDGAPAAAMRGALIDETGPGQLHAIRAGRNSLGRAEGCDVLLADGKVSQQHGYLFIRDEGATFIDTSTNGSVVDGVRIHGGQVEVRHGSRLELGGARLLLLLAPER